MYVPLVEAFWTVMVIDAVGVELVLPFAERVSWVGETVRLVAGGPELPPPPPPPPQAVRDRTANRHAKPAP